MKTTGKLFTLLFVLAGLTSCYSSIPLEKKPSENNTTYTVSYLFEHDGCKVSASTTWAIMFTSLPGET